MRIFQREQELSLIYGRRLMTVIEEFIKDDDGLKSISSIKDDKKYSKNISTKYDRGNLNYT